MGGRGISYRRANRWGKTRKRADKGNLYITRSKETRKTMMARREEGHTEIMQRRKWRRIIERQLGMGACDGECGCDSNIVVDGVGVGVG